MGNPKRLLTGLSTSQTFHRDGALNTLNANTAPLLAFSSAKATVVAVSELHLQKFASGSSTRHISITSGLGLS